MHSSSTLFTFYSISEIHVLATYWLPRWFNFFSLAKSVWLRLIQVWMVTWMNVDEQSLVACWADGWPACLLYKWRQHTEGMLATSCFNISAVLPLQHALTSHLRGQNGYVMTFACPLGHGHVCLWPVCPMTAIRSSSKCAHRARPVHMLSVWHFSDLETGIYNHGHHQLTSFLDSSPAPVFGLSFTVFSM